MRLASDIFAGPATRCKQPLCDITKFMRRLWRSLGIVILCATSLAAQGRRLWVLRAPGEMVEYDPATFAVKQTVKVPADALQAPQSLQVNHQGQMLFAVPVSLPLADTDMETAHKIWFWNGQSATSLDAGVKRETGKTGSNQAVTESAPSAFLFADGTSLLWFANQARRLQREEMDLSTTTSWQAWRTDLNGGQREDLAADKFPDCRCATGSCEESCPYGVIWVPEPGVGSFFFVTQFVSGKTEPGYKSSTRIQQAGGKWASSATAEPLRHVLDAAPGGDVIVEAIPDTGCCGWSNASNDQTRVLDHGKAVVVFDELATYKNPDYDVSFFTPSAQLSPDLAHIAMTIASTAQAGKPIQLAEEGQANPEESKLIRTALAELPAVEVKSLGEAPRRLAFVPHATLVGWISEKEILIVEDHVLVAYTVGTGARRKSSVRVEDAGVVFLR